MKPILTLLALLALLGGCLLAPVSAMAYWDYNTQLALMDDDLPEIYGTLNQKMATRTGPSTGYPEPGTFLAKGDQVRIISVAFDKNDVPWVQVEIVYGNKRMRVYTGLKRFDGVDVNDIPHEFNYGFDLQLVEDVTPRYGPGTQYAVYSFTLKAGSTVIYIDDENGYSMCDFYDESAKTWNRVFIPADKLTQL